MFTDVSTHLIDFAEVIPIGRQAVVCIAHFQLFNRYGSVLVNISCTKIQGLACISVIDSKELNIPSFFVTHFNLFFFNFSIHTFCRQLEDIVVMHL